jgi:hypothetical protein
MGNKALSVFLASLFGASFLAAQAFAADFLTRDEVKKLVAGGTVHVEGTGGVKFRAYFDPNGKVTRKQDNQVMEGVWRVQDNGALCVRYGDKEERCGKVEKSGDGTHTRVDDANTAFRWTKATRGKDL